MIRKIEQILLYFKSSVQTTKISKRQHVLIFLTNGYDPLSHRNSWLVKMTIFLVEILFLIHIYLQ